MPIWAETAGVEKIQKYKTHWTIDAQCTRPSAVHILAISISFSNVSLRNLPFTQNNSFDVYCVAPPIRTFRFEYSLQTEKK